MKQAVSILFATVFSLLSGISLWAEQDPLFENVVIETFDGPGASKFPSGTNATILQDDGNPEVTDISGQDIIWKVDNSLASRYATEEFPVAKYTNTWPIDLFGVNPQDGEDKQVFGVRSKFDRQGYNYFAIYAGAEVDGEWAPQALPLSNNDRPGRIQNINVWVWGANYDYTIEMHVRDYSGVTHVLPMKVVSGVDFQKHRSGSLIFTGWRKMSATIPSNVRQNSRYSLQDYRLQFVKFVIRTSPYERVDDFYIYFDQMQVTIDPYSNFYDGKNLSVPSNIKEIWGEGNTGSGGSGEGGQ